MGMTVADLPAIGARLSNSGAWHQEYQAFVNYLGTAWNTTSTDVNAKPTLAADAGFVYTLWPYVTGINYGSHPNRAEWGAKGVEWLIDTIDGTVPLGDQGTRLLQARLHFYAFDWLYNAMSAAERSQVVNRWALDMSPTNSVTIGPAEKGYPSYAGFNWADSGYANSYGAWILAGLAARGYGGAHEAWLQTGIDRYMWAFRNSAANGEAIVTSETRRAAADGGFVQNESYGFAYVMWRVLTVELAYRTANQIAKPSFYTLADAGWIRGMPYHWQRYLDPYAPSDGSFLGRNWHFIQSPGQTVDALTAGALIHPGYLGILAGELQGVDDNAANLAAWLVANRTNDARTTGDQKMWVLSKFLRPRNTPQGASSIGMPGDKATAAGRWHWRTGWDSQADALVHVYADEFFWNAHDIGMGAPVIYYNGPILPVGPVFNHEHDSAQGWGFSTMGFPPAANSTSGTLETGNPERDDYGYKRTNRGAAAFRALAEQSTADMLADTTLFRTTTQDGQGIGYLWLDLSRAYQGDVVDDKSGAARKIVSAHRKFIYVPPADPGSDNLRLFLFDSATTKSTAFEKRQQFVLAGEPTINGQAAPGPSRNGSTANKTTYTGATTISYGQTTLGSNRIWISPVAPFGTKVVKVLYRRTGGSPSPSTEDPFGRLHEATNISSPHRGQYRVEIIPSTSQLTDHFVTAIEVAPSVNGTQSVTQAIPGTGFSGARIGDTIGIHANDYSPHGGSVVIPTAGTYRVFVAGLGRAVNRTFNKGGNISTLAQVGGGGCESGCTATPQGSLMFNVVVSGSGTGAANTITIGPAVGVTVPQAPSGVRVVPSGGQ